MPADPTDQSAALAIIDLFGPPGGVAVLELCFDRELSDADLVLLEEGVGLGLSTPPIAKIREVHHHVARLLAEGRKGVEVSAITGYSQSRISILKRDPAFSELLAYYKGQTAVVYQTVHEKLAQVGTMALEELRDKLEDGELSTNQLIKVVEMGSDRSVAPLKGGSAPAGGGGQIPALTIQFISPPAGGLASKSPDGLESFPGVNNLGLVIEGALAPEDQPPPIPHPLPEGS